MDDWFPENPYLARGEKPWVGGARPINQGDVFCDVPSWAERTGEEEGFQSWLDLPSPIRPGSSRRETLGADYEEIRDEMITEIGDVAR